MDILHCFHFSTIRNNAALNIRVQVFVSMPFFKLKDIHLLHLIIYSAPEGVLGSGVRTIHRTGKVPDL